MSSSAFHIRPVQGEDLQGICRVAEAALPADPFTPDLFARKVFLDQNFDSANVQVAETGGTVIGFAVSYTRRYPIEDMPDNSDRSWITLFAVAPEHQRQGVATALFEALESRLAAEGKSSVLVGPYTPNWWVPGVDVNAYPAALEFLSNRGYTEVVRPLSMDSNLVTYRRPEWVTEKEQSLLQQGVEFREFEPELIPKLFDFLRREFPGDWQRHIRETSARILRGEYGPQHIRCALDKGQIIGFAHFEGERFGPFGTAVSERGRGVGAVLLCHTVEAMRAGGLHNAFFLWTSDQSAKLYSEANFRESRRFALMKKSLGE